MGQISTEERYSTMRARLLASSRLSALVETGVLDQVVAMLRGKRRVMPFEEDPEPLDVWVMSAVSDALAPPDLAETMTAGERAKLAKTIRSSAEHLSKALEEFKGNAGFRWPFQPVLDRLALELAIEEAQLRADSGFPVDDDTTRHFRSAIYQVLMRRMDSVLAGFAEAADVFAETHTLIKKPNDRNADRLYFIRLLNRKFCLEFRSRWRCAGHPARVLTVLALLLRLASTPRTSCTTPRNGR